MAHKLARRALAVGDKVLRYGAVIGSVQRPIARGEHIHTDNLSSDYLPTYTLQDGSTAATSNRKSMPASTATTGV